MADAILMSGGVGGVASDDVTARREHVLQGYTALTADGDDEPVQGTIPDKGIGNINARPDVMDWGNSRMSIVRQSVGVGDLFRLAEACKNCAKPSA